MRARLESAPALVAAALLAAGCGGGTDAGLPPPGPHDAGPPDGADDGGPPCFFGEPASTDDPAFAFVEGFLGDTDRAGNVDPLAWRTFGVDLDGLTTTPDSTDVCQRLETAPPENQEDGEAGIDNSFGRNVVPILIEAGSPEPSKSWTTALLAGRSTVLLRLPGLVAGAPGPLPGSAYFSAARCGPPAHDGNDVFPVDLASVDGSLDAPRTAAPGGAIDDLGVWRSGDLGTALVTMPINEHTVTMTLHHARIEATVMPDLASLDLGTIAGIVATTELVEQLRVIAGYKSHVFCAGPIFESFAKRVRQASDILLDGTQDPARPCDGVSVGIGFRARRARLGQLAEVPPSPDPCP